MANEIFARFQLKYDTLSNWLDLSTPGQGGNLILKQGEVGFCEIPAASDAATTAPTVLFKVGDGTLPFHHADSSKCLKWASALAADVYDWAKRNEVKIEGAGNAVTGVSIKDGYLTFNKGETYVTSDQLDALVGGLDADTNTQYHFEIPTSGDNKDKLVIKKKDITDADFVDYQVLELMTADALAGILNPIEKKIDDHIADKENPHEVTKTQVGLGNVDNTSDADKPVSTAQAQAIADALLFTDDTALLSAHGGLAAGSKLNGMTVQEIIAGILFPYTKPSISSSSRSAKAATLENGATQTLNSCSITVAKKSKPITSIKLYNGSTLLQEKTGTNLSGSYTFNEFTAITVSKSSNPNLKFSVTDGTGTTEQTLGASTFVYPYYWGVCAPDATIDEALVEGLTKKVESKGNKSDVKFTCANQKIVFAYPKAHGVLKSIIDPNNFETFSGYERKEVSITGLDGTAQAYYVYVQKDACTVTDFAVDFKY